MNFLDLEKSERKQVYEELGFLLPAFLPTYQPPDVVLTIAHSLAQETDKTITFGDSPHVGCSDKPGAVYVPAPDRADLIEFSSIMVAYERAGSVTYLRDVVVYGVPDGQGRVRRMTARQGMIKEDLPPSVVAQLARSSTSVLFDVIK